jgi:hypothetical protein
MYLISPKSHLHRTHGAKCTPDPLVKSNSKNQAYAGRDDAHHQKSISPVINIGWVNRNTVSHEAHHACKDHPSEGSVSECVGDWSPSAHPAQESVEKTSPRAQIPADVSSMNSAADQAHEHDNRDTESKKWISPSESNGEHDDRQKTPLNDVPLLNLAGNHSGHVIAPILASTRNSSAASCEYDTREEIAPLIHALFVGAAYKIQE